ncbi:MAG: transcription antitermination factor NusB [Bacteroidetes bacterium]|nr:MAG: transcription antitermination factor NusB [Bacteroidota bacterium]REK08122.1 MAG: transcription antitermination factor NusB [Bacteroidota bacterium]REK32327.1 MAG: transcription antitermination factor NusB [Bacteroidota bacterium]REK49561.1 MAG: transcription antitermination factor NusB [Bacteroidota bacterium]
MLSRRQLRIKVLQSLYAYFQAEKNEFGVAERELFRSIEKVYELYLYLLNLLEELADADRQDADELRQKFYPDEKELKAKRRLHSIGFITKLSGNDEYRRMLKRTGLSWQKERDLLRKMFLEIKRSDEYKDFFSEEVINEKDFLIDLIKKHFLETDTLSNHLEEENIFWPEDLDFICHIIIRMIRSYYDSGDMKLMPLYKDEEDDKSFVKTLFSKTILHNPEYENAISERTKNWEVERIALMDILILKMALAELVHFPGIPVKVTINEYIDISKEYSTPKSKQFVNGVIDKLAIDYKEQGKIQKSGRGLIG